MNVADLIRFAEEYDRKTPRVVVSPEAPPIVGETAAAMGAKVVVSSLVPPDTAYLISPDALQFKPGDWSEGFPSVTVAEDKVAVLRRITSA